MLKEEKPLDKAAITSSGEDVTISANRTRKDVKKVEKFFRKAGDKIRFGMTGQGRGRRYRRRKPSIRHYEENGNDESGDDEGEEISLMSHFRKVERSELPGEQFEIPNKNQDSNCADNSKLNNGIFNTIISWEAPLRNILALILSFVLGASFGTRSLDWVAPLGRLVILGWIISIVAKRKKTLIDVTSASIKSEEQGNRIVDQANGVVTSTEDLILLADDAPDHLSEEKKAENELESHEQHPEMMSKVFFLNASNLERVVPNSREYILDSEFFSGTMFLMIRTPDVDKGRNTQPNDFVPRFGSVAAKVSDYFKDKRRQFEFQFQIKLKKLPKGPLFLGCEFEQPLKLGMIQRALASAILGIVQKMNAVHFSYGMDENGNVPSQELIKDGGYERAHIAFGMEDGMDRLIVTHPGEPLPKLGEPLYEDPESVKHRKKTGYGAITWNLEDTYTMAFWSAYINFIDWKVIGLPGIRPFSIASMIGEQPLTLSLYSIPDRNARFHFRRDLHSYVQLEISHTANTSGGLIEKYQTLAISTGAAEKDEISETGDEEQEFGDVAIGVDIQENDRYGDDDDEINEFGDGLYLRYDDPIVLCESNIKGIQSDTQCFVAHRRGFALLQSHEPSYQIVLEKQQQSKAAKHQGGSIRNGDTVMIKIIKKDNVRYLSTHRGWWLKFVKHPPRHNGTFYICSCKPKEYAISESSGVASPYIALDTPFTLRHQRWSHYEVGASEEASARAGGRLLGLRRVTDSRVNYASEKDGNYEKPDYVDRQGQKHWLRPLQLRANLPTLGGESNRSNPLMMTPIEGEKNDQTLLLDEVNLDASAWIEMVHRNKRCKQRAFIIRIARKNSDMYPTKSSTCDEIGDKKIKGQEIGCLQSDCQGFRIRTGSDLTSIMQLARTIRTGEAENNFRCEKTLGDDYHGYEFPESDGGDDASDSDSEEQNFSDFSSHEYHRDHDVFQSCDNFPTTDVPDMNQSPNSEVASPSASYPANLTANTCSSPKKNWMKSQRIERLAKNMKHGTLKVAHTVEKSTAIAGKALTKGIYVPVKADNDKKEGPLVAKKVMKSPRARLLSLNSTGEKMCPADQSVLSITHTFADLANLAASNRFCCQVINSAIASTLASRSDLDKWFLLGGATDIGVIPLRSSDEVLLHGALVARALWDTHWREEWCGIYTSKIEYYAPLTNKPVFSLSLADIEKVRLLELDSKLHPLSGLPILVLETAWRCHYLAFSSLKSREKFASHINDAIYACVRNSNQESEKEHHLSKRDKSESFRWQSFQAAIQSSVSNGRGKWETVWSSQKRKRRAILNGRCMAFDLKPFEGADSHLDVESVIVKFVEDLLLLALSLDQNSLTLSPETLLLFLNKTSRLTAMPFHLLNFSGKGAYCVFVNLFHCLLQHALLLSVYGPPNQRSIEDFMRCSCYEVGGDVFSLAEIESIILRGNLSSAANVKAPFVVASKEARSVPHFSLTMVDARINFLLNHGTFADLPWVPVLRTETLDSQVTRSCALFLKQEVSIDRKKKIITLPKICEVYRHDFGGDGASPLSSLLFCMQFLRDDVDAMMDIINDDDYTIKFKHSCCNFQYCLKREDEELHSKLSLSGDEQEL